MHHDRNRSGDALHEFLRTEAATELERLRSIADIVCAGGDRRPEGGGADDSAHEVWLRATYGPFTGPRQVEAREGAGPDDRQCPIDSAQPGPRLDGIRRVRPRTDGLRHTCGTPVTMCAPSPERCAG
jgi:hypothetical protein